MRIMNRAEAVVLLVKKSICGKPIGHRSYSTISQVSFIKEWRMLHPT